MEMQQTNASHEITCNRICRGKALHSSIITALHALVANLACNFPDSDLHSHSITQEHRMLMHNLSNSIQIKFIPFKSNFVQALECGEMRY